MPRSKQTEHPKKINSTNDKKVVKKSTTKTKSSDEEKTIKKPKRRVPASITLVKETPQLTTGIFKLFKQLKESPSPKMKTACKRGHFKEGSASDATILKVIAKLPISNQAMSTLNSYAVDHMKQLSQILGDWAPGKKTGKTITKKKVLASIPYVYMTGKDQYRVRQEILKAIQKYKDSYEKEEN